MYKYNNYNKKKNGQIVKINLRFDQKGTKMGGNIFELNNPKRLSDVEHSIYPFGLG